MWIAYASAWLATGFATAAGLYYTQDANCLWAMIIPTLVSLSIKKDRAET